MGLRSRSNEGFGERQTSTICRRLQDDVYVLRVTDPVREVDVPNAFGEAGHVIAIGAKLLRDRRM